MVVEYWFLLLPLGVMCSDCFLSGLLYFVGLSPRVLPLVNRLWWRVDCAVVLRWLATAVRQQRPIAEMVRLLAGYFPQRRLRRRLEWSAKRIEQGADWCDSLCAAGVLRKRTATYFGLPSRPATWRGRWTRWRTAPRRSAYRFRAFVSVAFPLTIALFGGGVFLMAVSMLLPLMSLVQRLA